jgi:hypothetical protein
MFIQPVRIPLTPLTESGGSRKGRQWHTHIGMGSTTAMGVLARCVASVGGEGEAGLDAALTAVCLGVFEEQRSEGFAMATFGELAQALAAEGAAREVLERIGWDLLDALIPCLDHEEPGVWGTATQLLETICEVGNTATIL